MRRPCEDSSNGASRGVSYNSPPGFIYALASNHSTRINLGRHAQSRADGSDRVEPLEGNLGMVFSPQLRWLGFLYRSQRFLICFRKRILQSIYNYNTYLLLYMGARGAHCYR
jgi:hypothetical protein